VKKLLASQQHVIGLHKINYYFASHIGGVSENPFNFSVLSGYTVNCIGENYMVMRHHVMKRYIIGRW
jgi:hypothetical protein